MGRGRCRRSDRHVDLSGSRHRRWRGCGCRGRCGAGRLGCGPIGQIYNSQNLGMTWAVGIAVFGSIGVLIAISFLQWTGWWRSWYRPEDAALSLVFTALGPSPLLVPFLLGGVLLMIGFIYVSSLVHIHLLIGIGIDFGLAGLLLAAWM